MKVAKVIKHGNVRWQVHYRDGGGYRRMSFASKTKADAFAADLATEQRLHGDIARLLTPEQRERYMTAERQLAAVGATLEDAVTHFLKTGQKLVKRTVAQAVAECLAVKESTGRRPRYLQQLGYSLGYFVRDCSERDVGSITAVEVQDWLGRHGWASYTRRNRRIDLRTLFAFAVKRGYALSNPVDGVEQVMLEDTPPGILTPDQSRQLLDAVRAQCPRLLAFVAICLFAGLRRSETLALTWEDIDLERCHIIVAGHKAKTRKRRLVTIQPNLAEWLKLGGDLPIKNRDNALTAAYRLIGPNWPANALRHSFVSYHLAMFNDVGKTALEAGNSPDMVFRHYRELVTKADAERFWGILPR